MSDEDDRPIGMWDILLFLLILVGILCKRRKEREDDAF